MPGAEAGRLGGAENSDIRPRVFFYVDKGNGVYCEPGVGSYCHHVQLDNLYDVSRDMLNIVKQVLGKSWRKQNGWERAILTAGFDGYLMDHPVMPQGYAVLLGTKHGAVPVDQTQVPSVVGVWFDMLKTASCPHSDALCT